MPKKILAAMFQRAAARDYRQKLAQLPLQPRVANMTAIPSWLVSVNYRAEDHGRPDHATAVGVLISDRHVLTVAHTFHDTGIPGDPPEEAKTYFVRVGGRLAGSGHAVPVKVKHQHPDFNMDSAATVDADIAILELDGTIDAAPLAVGEDDVAEGTPVRVLGARGPNAPGFVGVDTLTISRRMAIICSPKDRDLCIAGGPKDTNFGHGFSGGPVLLTDGTDRLVAVVSRGGNLRRAEIVGQPGVCTDVTKYRQWIADIIGEQQPKPHLADVSSRQPQP